MEDTQPKVYASFVVVEYKKIFAIFGFISMFVFHLPLLLNKKTSFYKLFGLGKRGSFDLNPDLTLYAIFATHELVSTPTATPALDQLYGKFVALWIKVFSKSNKLFWLQPVEGHGSWDTKTPFGSMQNDLQAHENVAVLTRATISFSKLISFWKHVPQVAKVMNTVQGLKYSYGIGEIPILRQATFSVWENLETVKNFAYRMGEHKEIIQKTRKEKWYTEEMFVRFKILN